MAFSMSVYHTAMLLKVFRIGLLDFKSKENLKNIY